MSYYSLELDLYKTSCYLLNLFVNGKEKQALKELKEYCKNKDIAYILIDSLTKKLIHKKQYYLASAVYHLTHPKSFLSIRTLKDTLSDILVSYNDSVDEDIAQRAEEILDLFKNNQIEIGFNLLSEYKKLADESDDNEEQINYLQLVKYIKKEVEDNMIKNRLKLITTQYHVTNVTHTTIRLTL